MSIYCVSILHSGLNGDKSDRDQRSIIDDDDVFWMQYIRKDLYIKEKKKYARISLFFHYRLGTEERKK